MKKMRMISILIVIVLSTLSTTTVLAEEFTLHNGVKFGMNMNEVSTAETNADFSVDKTEDSIIVMGFHKPCGIHDSEYLTVSGTIAGYDGEIEYHFNNDSLESAIYFLGWGQMPGSCTNQFDDINKTLSEKYGDADDSIQEMLERRYLDSCYYSTGYSLDNLHTMTISALNAYKCSQDDGVVIILPAVIRTYLGGTFIMETIEIEYHYYSKEDIDSATNQTITDNDDL